MTRSRRTVAAGAAVVTGALAVTAALSLGSGSSQEGDGAARQRAVGRHAPRAARPTFDLRILGRGLARPTGVQAAPGDADGLWVTEQTGRLVRLQGRRVATVLDVSARLSVGAERGLLGLAFHPDFARNRRLVVDYTDRHGDTRVVEYRVGPGERADPATARLLLSVDQPEANHNGGALVFATDGRLLVGMGDGGGAFDRRNRAQDLTRRLGKILRADIDGRDSVRWTVLAAGLRNPWRIWMDPALDEIWIGDVGQDTTEEIDRIRYEPDEPPKNLGWPAWEGDNLLDAGRLNHDAEPVAPVAVYDHDEGCSVTGGLIYRGTRLDALRGRYVYGDFCTGTVWTLRPGPALAVTEVRRETVRIPQLTSIGTDADGELVFATADGKILSAVEPRAEG